MARFFKRRTTRRGRPRTRWFSITPFAQVPNVDGYFGQNQVDIEDKDGAYSWQNLVGGTLLRVILDVQMRYFLDSATFTAAATQYAITHTGLCVTEDNTLSSTIWDPNKPFGDFMHRGTISHAVFLADQSAYPGLSVMYPGENPNELIIDTQVKRRLRENSALWFTTKTFMSAAYSDTVGAGSIALGGSGRVLIQLP